MQPSQPRIALCTAMFLFSWPQAGTSQEGAPDDDARLDEIVIVGDRDSLINTTGAAHVIPETRLEQFRYADIQRMIREVPGVSVQVEDVYGLRPNLSIRGTATERSGRITLLEDNVLIAPAPYSAPSAYYFPTAGRMRQVEVLKGSSAIKQGPYTVGGAVNFLSTAIPSERQGQLDLEYGDNETSRLHGVYGDSFENFGWLVEGHLWDSAGYQDIDKLLPDGDAAAVELDFGAATDFRIVR